MSLDKSLRSHGELVRHRNVLTRAERIQALKDAGKWEDDRDIFALPKVAHRKVTTKKVKVAAAAAEGAEAAAGAEAAPAAGAAAPKAGAAAAAPKTAGAPKAAAASKAAAAPKAAGKGKA